MANGITFPLPVSLVAPEKRRGRAKAPALPLDELLPAIAMTHWRRERAVDAHRAQSLRIQSMFRHMLAGFGVEDVKKEAAAAFATLSKGAVEDVGADDRLVQMFAVTRAQWDALELFAAERKELEKQLVSEAKQLPVYDWWKSQKGLGDIGLGQIVGEARAAISDYKTPSALWKRFGLGLVKHPDGKWYTQGRPGQGAAAELWLLHGFSKTRRAIMHNIGSSMIRAKGAYYGVYEDRKGYEIDRDPDIKPILAHKRAMRFMEKRILKDLWVEWRKLDGIKDTVPEREAA